MPSVKLTDQLGVEVEVKPNSASSFGRYLADVARFRFPTLDLSALRDKSLAAIPLQSIALEVQALPTSAKLPITAALGGTLEITSPQADDDWFEQGSTYLSLGFTLALGAAPSAGSEAVTWGVDPGVRLRFTNHRRFAGTTNFRDALMDTLRDFVLPLSPADLEGLSPDVLTVMESSRTLEFAAEVNLLAATNPLMTASLPSPAPQLSVTAGGMIAVAASFAIESEHELRARKPGANQLRLSWRRKIGSEFGVKVRTKAGITAGTSSLDLVSTLLGVISRNPSADFEELRAAGLGSNQIGAISGAIQAAIERRLELAATFALGSARAGDSIFEYQVDLAELTEDGHKALSEMLRGNVSAVSRPDSIPAGFRMLSSVFSRLRETNHLFKVNLLGIYNVGSISKLALSGTVRYEPDTGDLVIADSATASRITTAAVNFGADSQKLRRVLAESFLITAAYRSSQRQADAPQLEIFHTYFELHNGTNHQTMKDNLDIAQALGLLSKAEKEDRLRGLDDFGRTVCYADARYDNKLARALFLADGEPLAAEVYEKAGREALALLVQEDDPDAYRRAPALNDELWRKMKSLGQPNLHTLFPQLQGPQLGAVIADYSLIVGWAEAMRETGEKLARIDRFLRANPGIDLKDVGFQALREDLTQELKSVAANTKKEFGDPWGLVAMDRVSGGAAAVRIQYTGPRLAFEVGREGRFGTARAAPLNP